MPEYRDPNHADSKAGPLEQGEDDRCETPTQDETRLGNSNNASKCSPSTRSSAVQSGDRQQT